MNTARTIPGNSWHQTSSGAVAYPVEQMVGQPTPADRSKSSIVASDDCCIVAEICSPKKRRLENTPLRAEASSTGANHHDGILSSRATTPGVPEPKFTSVCKLLTKDSVIPWFRLTNADILLHWHKGATVDVKVIHPSGVTEAFILGDYMSMPDKCKYSFSFPPFTWLAMKLELGSSPEFAFLSATVVPGYRAECMELGQPQDLIEEAGVLHSRMITEFFKPNGVHLFS